MVDILHELFIKSVVNGLRGKQYWLIKTRYLEKPKYT